MEKYLEKTKILDFKSKSIIELIKDKGWEELNQKDKIGEIYNFIQNDILFGFSKSDNIPASIVLEDGYGQCNTKNILFMSLLRAVGIPCRFHGFTIHKRLQKGLINGLAYLLAPNEILHSWVEVNFNNKWFNLEGLILDKGYLQGLRAKINNPTGAFCGYAVDVNDFGNLQIKWNESDTFIQKEGIVSDLGIFDSPDEFYKNNGVNLGGFKQFLYEKLVRAIMNNNVKKIRI